MRIGTKLKYHAVIHMYNGAQQSIQAGETLFQRHFICPTEKTGVGWGIPPIHFEPEIIARLGFHAEFLGDYSAISKSADHTRIPPLDTSHLQMIRELA